MKKKFLTAVLPFFGLIFIQAQTGTSRIKQVLEQEKTGIMDIIGIITNIVIGIFSLVALVKLIQIFISQGQGEEKLNKAGTWIFMLIFCAIGFVLSRLLF